MAGRSGVYFKSKMSTDWTLISALKKKLFSLDGGTTVAHLQATLIDIL